MQFSNPQFPIPRSRRPSWALLRWSAAAAMIAAGTGAYAADDVAGYLTYGGGRPVTSSGQCVHTLEWQPGMQLADCEPKPPVAAAPVVEVVEVVETPKAPPPPVVVPFRLSLDMLFDYDSAALKAGGRDALDALAAQIASSDYQNVQITGYADPIGTASYNQSLSERRAQVIAAYLAGRGVDAAKLAASGAGSVNASVTLEDCKGRRRAALIECLQPDRYADVTVTGTVQQAATSTGDTK
jgi:OOP family OmpA-OmpF porin